MGGGAVTGAGTPEEAAPEERDNRLVWEEFSDKLKGMGFDPGIPVYEVTVPFTEKDIKAALFKSSYASPKILSFRIDHGGGDSWDVPMVVELVQAIYTPYRVGKVDRPLGCWPYPEWHIRGFLFKSPFDPYNEVIRVHALVQKNSPDELDMAYIQVVREPSDASSETRLEWGHGAP
jgi:hypothetical protein